MAHLSLFPPFSSLCLWGDHSYTPQNYIPGAVMHKQRPRLKEAQIIWCPAPQELAVGDMTVSITAPRCTTASDGFWVLIKAVLITFPPKFFIPTGPMVLCVYKLATLSSRFICPAAAGKVNKLPSEISSDSKLLLRCIVARHLWLRNLLYRTGNRIQNSEVPTQ